MMQFCPRSAGMNKEATSCSKTVCSWSSSFTSLIISWKLPFNAMILFEIIGISTPLYRAWGWLFHLVVKLIVCHSMCKTSTVLVSSVSKKILSVATPRAPNDCLRYSTVDCMLSVILTKVSVAFIVERWYSKNCLYM